MKPHVKTQRTFGNLRDTNYPHFSWFEKNQENLVMQKIKSRKIKWLGLEKFSKILKMKCHKILPYEIKFPKIRGQAATVAWQGGRCYCLLLPNKSNSTKKIRGMHM